MCKTGAENAHCQTKIAQNDTCAELCQLSKDSRDAFLPRITSDETWLHYYDPLTKRQSMKWHHLTIITINCYVKKNSKWTSPVKVMVSAFWDSEGKVEFLDSDPINNSQHCVHILNQLKQ